MGYSLEAAATCRGSEQSVRYALLFQRLNEHRAAGARTVEVKVTDLARLLTIAAMNDAAVSQ